MAALLAGSAQQRQGRIDAVDGTEEVGGKDSLDKVDVEVASVQIFAGAGVEDRQIQASEGLGQALTGLFDGLAIRDVQKSFATLKCLKGSASM
jgi:hypothetical protein